MKQEDTKETYVEKEGWREAHVEKERWRSLRVGELLVLEEESGNGLDRKDRAPSGSAGAAVLSDQGELCYGE